MKLAAPLYVAAHVAHLPTLAGWDTVTVYEGGRLDRGDIRRWATIGYVAGDDGPAVHVEPDTAAQGQTVEGGSIACNLVVIADDIPAARAAVFDLLAPWGQWLADDRTLAAALGQAELLPQSVASLVFDVALTTTRAATASAVVTITYTAHTYG
jgi:hypothetical protein